MTELKIELPTKLGGRLPVLDELKGLAILLIVLYHAGGVLVWQNLLHGDLGVDIFVILSGVGLALSQRTETSGAFLRRRLIRIMPAYWIVLTLFWALNSYFLQKNYSGVNVVLHYLGIHGWFGDMNAMSINDSFWFITLIITLYLIFCVVRHWREDLGRLIFAGGAFSWIFASAMFFTGQAGSFGHLGLRVPGFFAGLILGRLLCDGRISVKLDWPLFGGLVMFAYMPYMQGFIFFSPLAALALMSGYTNLWKRFVPTHIQSPISSALTFLGNHSLEIFLLHQPIIREYNYYLHGRVLNIPVPSTSSLLWGMLLGAAVALFLSIELRALVAKLLPREKSPS
ncbi:MAG: acyltransferase [Opitutaceae bacterium]|jgi:peptidoglycan/LPS O-acetylase OafA/YrhL